MMARLFLILLAYPWWAYIPIGGGVLYLTEQMYQAGVAIEAEKAEVLSLGAPDAVNLSNFRRENHIGTAQEVTVTGWFNFAYNTDLPNKLNVGEIGEKHLFVLFGQQDLQANNVARAAIILSDSEQDWFLENIMNFFDLEASSGQYSQFTFNGFGREMHPLNGEISQALANYNLVQSPEFIYLTPFLEGRDVALAPIKVSQDIRLFGLLFALMFIATGLAKLFVRKSAQYLRYRPKVDPFAQGDDFYGAEDPYWEENTVNSTCFEEGSADAERLKAAQARAAQMAAEKARRSFTDMVPALGIGVIVAIFLLSQTGLSSALVPLGIATIIVVGMIAGLQRISGMFSGVGKSFRESALGCPAKMYEDPFDHLGERVHIRK